jgi:serine/threonine protein kinase
MPKLGIDVDQYFNSMRKSLSAKSIIHLGMKVLKILEKVHSSGYVYGDLKLDNILIGEGL